MLIDWLILVSSPRQLGAEPGAVGQDPCAPIQRLARSPQHQYDPAKWEAGTWRLTGKLVGSRREGEEKRKQTEEDRGKNAMWQMEPELLG